MFTKLNFPALVLVLGLTACSTVGTITGTSLATLASSSVGSSLLNALLNTLAPGVNAAIAKGGAAAQADLKLVAYALPWAQQALDFFGPAVGVPTAKIAGLDATLKDAEAILANPPTDVATAVLAGTTAWQDVMAVLKPVVVVAPVK